MTDAPRSAGRKGLLPRFGRDRRGVAAVEFAFIAPVLVLLYSGVAELCTVMMADRRVAHADSAIGDLAAQVDKLRDADVADIFSAATTILSPFDVAPLQLRLTSITINAGKAPKVEWSAVKSTAQGDLRQLNCNELVANFPADLATTPGDNVIMAEAVYKYTLPMSFGHTGDLYFKPRYFMRPRTAAKVARYENASATPVVCPIS